jgi:DNA-binding NtrC family response regulator
MTKGEILFIDDEMMICRLAKKQLDGRNMSVTAMTDGTDILQILNERNPCLVVLDLHLAEESGLEVLKRIKEVRPQLPVIIVTGDNNSIHAEVACKLGASDFMTKPINWAYLRNVAYLCTFMGEGAA